MHNPNPSWPYLTEYTGEQLAEVVFPLGGIGTGTIGLGGRAELRDFEICNRPEKGFTPPWTFFALRTQQSGKAAVTRVLEGAPRPPYAGSHGLMIAQKNVPRHPMLRSSGSGLPRMRHVSLRAAYPFARFELHDPLVPLVIHLEAFNPLIPLDPDRSGLPFALMRYVLTNPSDEPVEAAIAGSLYNFMGRVSRPDGTAGFMGGNLNEPRHQRFGDTGANGLLMRSLNVPQGSPEDGSMALVVLADEATLRTSWGPMQWSRNVQMFWDDFSEDGRLEAPTNNGPSKSGEGQSGSVATEVTVPPRSSTSITFMLCWHFPHRSLQHSGWNAEVTTGDTIGNYYALDYTDAWDVAEQIIPQLDQLEEDSLRFVHSFMTASLPQSVKEAALNNLSTLRSETCFRSADGHFFGFEGCWDDLGCCPGSCTHVWNYEQATPFLFPSLARNMRGIELNFGTLENGLNAFRVPLPLESEPQPRAAADGQMGVIVKCYREWQLSGDREFLRHYWPAIRSLLEFCWIPGSWDADQDGVMEGIQHNTSDIEFYGPNPLSGIWYLAALRAAAEMALAMNEPAFAKKCQELAENGARWFDDNLFNGEYYRQEIRVPSDDEPELLGLRLGLSAMDRIQPEFQVGNGCLSDQLVGQYMAHVARLGHLLDREHIIAALQAIYRYNFMADLYAHWNHLRSFALADEPALVVCTWPYNDAPPNPFFRAHEVWTGVEYQAAAHMIYEGMVDEGLTIVGAIRTRFDGSRRNPWNEQECGHHYVRAMASWSLLLALSGFHYSAVTCGLRIAPNWSAHDFKCMWSVPSGWGNLHQDIDGEQQIVQIEVCAGSLAVRSLEFRLPDETMAQSVSVRCGSTAVAASHQATGEHLSIDLGKTITATSENPLSVHIQLKQRSDI